ncbi:MAG: DUF4199 domain-containing protein [Duncaniella sp.]|nr:DUF4199 domain-containing protein [Duncaniella sp.]MDE7145920.1 DUF4199 domain-containing protein [Duncaniella sp.]
MIPSPYRRGADDGFLFGAYLTVMFLASLLSTRIPLLSMLSLLMAAGVPVVIYLFMRRFNARLKEFATFPMLWMQGVVIFVCGILIAGAFLVIYLQWIEPDYIINQLRGVAELGAGSGNPTLERAAELAETMIEAKMVPSPMAIVTEMILAAIFTGSLLSIIISAFFAIRRRAAINRFLNKH